MRKLIVTTTLLVLIVACSPSVEEEQPPVLSEVEGPTVAKEAKATQPSPTPATFAEPGETEEPAVGEMALPNQSVPTPPAGYIYHAVYPGEAIADSKPPPEDGIPFEEDGLTLEDLRSYEQHVGKTATWVYFSHNWFRERSFPLSTASWIRDAGSIPYIRLMLRSSSEQNVAEPIFTLDRIINGDFDDDLHVWARGARDFGSPLIAEYGTEANGEWFSWNGIWNGGGTQDGYGDPSEYDGPERFRDAYRHIIQIARDEGASNITWVFHANGEDIPDEAWNRLEEYYPGDEWVDWLGVSVYGALDPMDDEWPQFRDSMDAVYPRLAALSPDKPIVLLEFGVAAGNPLGDQAEWAEAALTDLVAFRWPRLIGFSWWNEHWENDDDPSHDSVLRVQDNPDLAAVFQRLVGNEPNVLGNYRPAFTFAYETRPDGAIRLTDPPSDTSDQNPAFSPDGTHLLFTRFENGYNEGPAALYLLDLVSGNTNLLNAAPDSDSVNLPGTSWNAATNRITFASDREDSDEIWTMAADGSGLFRVTNQATAGYAIESSFSPDGQWIVFEFDNQVPDDKQQGSIWKIRADGSELTPLLDGPSTGTDNRQPNWSPVDNRILFQRRIPGSDDWNLYTMDPDGSNIQPVTTASSSDTDASWSPDGQWIVYSSDYEDLPTPNIFIIPANGGDPVRITHSESSGDGAASWSPDGQWIAFESYPSPADEETPAMLWLIKTLPLDAPLPPTTIKNQPPDKPHLAEVSTWFYMIDVNLESEMVERMAASEYDMVVLDFIPSEANNTDYPMTEVVDRLHNAAHPKRVLAYIDIGQAEDFRTYWQPDWGIGNPEWIVGSDPDGWTGNYPVAYWYEEWQDIWLGPDGMLQAILDTGFDGIYLDWVEAYSDENVVAFAESDGVDPRQEMIWWVEDIADFTHAQQADFIIIAQNAAELAQDDDYVEAIDAIAQEQVWFDGAADNNPPGDCPLPRTEAEIETEAYIASLFESCRTMYEEFPDSTLHVSSEEYLQDLTLAQSKGVLIFTVDYALESENVAWVYETSRELGFVPFVGNRALNQYVAPMTETNITPTTGNDWWQPGVDTTWQWQLSDQPIDQSYDVDMVDIDLFDNDASVVAALHSQGRKVVCYISVGSWEEWRPDADQFPAPAIGNDYEDWPGEKWLDIRQLDLLAPIMRARLDECQAKGFDGIEPDNIDAYTNDTGFSLTYEDQLKYNIWLANEAHERGLSIGLKNDPDQVIDLLPYFDWALTEDCFAEGWCEEMLPFIAAGKPVFAAEYTDTGITTSQFCPQAQEMGFSVILKNRDLEAYREACRYDEDEPETTPSPEEAPTADGLSLQRDFTLPSPLFAPDSAWNQTAAGVAILPESDQQILVTYRVLLGDITSISGYEESPTTWPFMDISLDEYAIPIFRAGTEQQEVLLCNYDGDQEWPHPKFGIDQQGGPVIVPAPAGMVRPAGPESTDADGHLVLYSPETFEEYDFWQATTMRTAECESAGGGQPGSTILEAGVIDFFDVLGPGANPDTYYSARAHGTPLLAGMILPEDIENGEIAHALAFAIPGPRNLDPDPSEPLSKDYFYPASTTETDFFNTDPHALAAGQRVRLKQTIVDDEGDLIDESQLTPITRMFLTGLRTYGAYLVDNAGGFSFSAEDIHTAILHLSDDEINMLIGQSPGTPLPTDKTKWEIVIDKLTEELERIPIAYGPWEEGQDPATAMIEISNFEVIEPAIKP